MSIASLTLQADATRSVTFRLYDVDNKSYGPFTVNLTTTAQTVRAIVTANALQSTGGLEALPINWSRMNAFVPSAVAGTVKYNWSDGVENPNTVSTGTLIATTAVSLPFDSAASAASVGFTIGLDLLASHLSAKRAWVDSPGFDIVWIGDSIPVTGSTSTGSSSNGRYRSTAVHSLSKRLQAKYNPAGVMGGLGYIPFYAGGAVPTTTIANGGDTICTTADPLNVASGDTCVQWSTSAVGTGGRDVGIASGSTRYIGGQLQSSLAYALQDRAVLDKLIVVGRKFATGGTLAIDAGTGWVARGAGGILSTTWDTAGATEYGARSGLLSCSSTLGDHRIVFRGAAAGNPVFADGAIYFIGDSASGVRSHGLNNPGSRLNLYGANSQSATIDPWTAMNGNPATNGGLVIISSLINDAVAAVSAAAYNTTLVDWIDKILARPSTPGVLLIVPVEPAFIGGLTEANFDALVTQIYATAATYAAAGAPVALLDLNVAFGLDGSRYDGKTRQLGVLNNDFTHLSNYGHARFADAVFSLFEEAWG